MPAATEEVDTGYAAVQKVRGNLDNIGSAVGGDNEDIEFLKEFLGSSIFQSMVLAEDRLEEQPSGPNEQDAGKMLSDAVGAIGNLPNFSPEAEELDRILSDSHIRALICAYDDILDKNYDEAPVAASQLMSPPPPVFNTDSNQIRLVGIRKSPNEPLGITVKLDENGELVIARILAGSMIDKQGLLHMGDVITEVNGYPVATPEQLMDIIRNMDTGGITLKVIPTFAEQHNKSQVFMKAHYNYDPFKDRLIPCKEAGLIFKDGDILEILSSDDQEWWQARKVDDPEGRAGLIPSLSLEEKRKAFVKPDYDYSKSSLLCGMTRRKKKKIKYSSKGSVDFDRCEMNIYEEVYRMPPFQRRTLVICGAHGVGRRSLKERLLRDQPRLFSAAMPHTSRSPREGEENGKGYYFTDRETMEDNIQKDNLLEWGDFNGNLYGTHIDTLRSVIEGKKMCVLDVNATSLRRLKNAEFMPYIVFIASPSAEILRIMYEEGRRRGKIAGPGVMEIKMEDDFLRTVTESGQIEKVYKGYFDLTMVNDDFDETYRDLRKALSELSTETQWVPVNWVY